MKLLLVYFNNEIPRNANVIHNFILLVVKWFHQLFAIKFFKVINQSHEFYNTIIANDRQTDT